MRGGSQWSRFVGSAFFALRIASLVAAEEGTDSIAGHWEGDIQLPSTRLGIRVDLERAAAGVWSGTIDIPVQGLRGFQLGAVVVEGGSVQFGMPGIPGEPQFRGACDPEHRRITGQFTQGGRTSPFALERRPKKPTAGETPARGVPGRGLIGHWQGSLKPAPVIELRLALEITNAASSKSGGVMVSIDQGGARIPLTEIGEEAGRVVLKARSVGGQFQGEFNEDGSEMVGEWTQSGRVLPLLFRRLDRAPSLNRPQEPKAPLPYRQQEVVVTNAGAGLTLAGTLTIPEGGGPHPAAVLITGSGPQDRDEAIMGHRPFLVLADHLTRAGIAVLRCDDRGTGGSTGSFATATTDDFVSDTLATVQFLRTRPEIDRRRIGLVGHSEGGIVAPRVAVASPEVAFVVLLAGVGVPMEELLVRQGADIARVLGASEDLIATNSAVQREIFRILRQRQDDLLLEKQLREVLDRQLAGLTPEQRRALGATDDLIENQVRIVITPWFRHLLSYDPRSALAKVRCPVLALNGERDLQVSAGENLPAIRAALIAGGNRDVTTTELPELNHLFQRCQTGAVAEYGAIEETFAPEALRTISTWIQERTNPAR